MSSNQEIDYIAFHWLFSVLYRFLREKQPQDAYSYALELFILQLLYYITQAMIDQYSRDQEKDDIGKSKNQHVSDFKEIVHTILSTKVRGIEIAGHISPEPNIDDIRITISDADNFLERLRSCKSSLEDYDIRMPGLFDGLEKFFFKDFPLDYIRISKEQLAHNFRMALAKGKFLKTTDKWPAAYLIDSQGKFQAVVELQPKKVQRGEVLSDREKTTQIEIMRQFASRMSDLTVDVYDILCDAWLNGRNPDNKGNLPEEEFLQRRGLKKHKSGSGRRGGYNTEQRQNIRDQLEILENLYLTYVKDDNNHSGKWHDCMDLIPNTRSYASLARQVLEYDPYRQAWEKRLARYLAWLWRIRKTLDECRKPIAVEVLLANAIGESVDKKNPKRTRERLEKALDRLKSDTLIASWQYTNSNETWMMRKGWPKIWLNWKISIEPPKKIIECHEKTALRGAKEFLGSKPSDH